MKHTFILIVCMVSFHVFAEEPVGEWVWISQDKSYVFSLDITKEDNGYSGKYNAAAMIDGKIDYDVEKQVFYFTLGHPFQFSSNKTESLGTAIISFDNQQVAFELLELPHKNHYAPREKVYLKKMSEVMAQESSGDMDNSQYYIGLEEDMGAYVLFMTQGDSLGAVSIHDIEDYRWFTQTLTATESINFHMSDKPHEDRHDFFTESTYLHNSRYMFEDNDLEQTLTLAFPPMEEILKSIKQDKVIHIGGINSKTYYIGSFQLLDEIEEYTHWQEANSETFCYFMKRNKVSLTTVKELSDVWGKYVSDSKTWCSEKIQ